MHQGHDLFLRGALVGSLVILGIFFLAGSVLSIPSATTAWHSLQDVAKTSLDQTSVDADGDGVIDSAENADIACGIGTNCTIDSADIVNGSIGSADINPAQIQMQVTGNCPAGNAIRVINSNGTVTCEAVTGGGSPSYNTATATTNSANGSAVAFTSCTNPTPKVMGCSLSYVNTSGTSVRFKQFTAIPTLPSSCSATVITEETTVPFSVTVYAICSSQ